MNLEATQHLLVKKSALFLLVVTSIATVVRPIIAAQDMIYTLVGIGNMVLLGLVYAFILRTQAHRYHALLVIFTGFVTLIPLMLLSGGVNSQFAVVLPILPVLVCLLTSSVVAWWVTGFIFVLIVTLRLVDDMLPNYAVEQLSTQKTNARAFWLCLTSLLSATFGNEFYRLSRKLGDKLQQQASIDSLTGVSNRGHIIDFLDDAIIDARQDNQWLTVLMIDADRFKQINDTYGHLVGDECLKKMAIAIEHSIRRNTDSVGRYGGEEFLVVLPGVDDNSAPRVAETIRQSIASVHVEVGQKTVTVSATIGYCSLPVTPKINGEQFMLLADKALFAGKKAGRNTIKRAAYSELPALEVTS